MCRIGRDRKTCAPCPEPRAFAASRVPLAASRSSALCSLLCAPRLIGKRNFFSAKPYPSADDIRELRIEIATESGLFSPDRD